MENKQLQAFAEVMPLLKDILQEDIGVAVADINGFLAYRPGDTIDLKTKVGSPLSEQEPLYKTIKEGKGYTSITPKEIYGVPFKAITYPIKDAEGNVIGAVGLSRSLKKQSEVEEASESLYASLQHTSAKIEEICGDSQKIFSMVQSMVELAKKSEKQIQESYEILTLIQNMSAQTRLLGLNASIEAARAGQHGKGFAVVAGEMKKLAQISGDSSREVSKTLMEMNESIKETIKLVEKIQAVSETQAASVKEVTNGLEQVIESSDSLHDLAKI